MAKIDTTKIEGYANMTPEQKLAALEGFEYEDNSAELEKQKNALSKANSEAAEWKRKHNALLTEEERKKQEGAEALSKMQQELDELRKDKAVADYRSRFIAQGYDETLADETARAMYDGNTEKVFANQQKFLDGYTKKLKADALKNTPRPAAGSGSASGLMDFDKKIEEAQQTGNLAAMAYYTRLKAEQEAQAHE